MNILSPYRRALVIPAFLLCLAAPLRGQEETDYGRITDISGKTVTAEFQQRDIAVGDVVEFWRFQSIIDPVSGAERGNSRTLIARGIVDDIGLGKASISVTEQIASEKVNKSDRVQPTGARKAATRKVGRIQELSADRKELTIDMGSRDEVGEGDEFLIQRTENIYDPRTNQVTGTNQVDVGRGRVSTVQDRSSKATVTRLEPGMLLQETDTVVFTPEAAAAPEVPADPAATDALRAEVEALRREVAVLRATVDSLGQEHSIDRQEFRALREELEQTAARLMTGDIQGTRLVARNPETRIVEPPNDLMAQYRRALEDCLAHRFGTAIPQFQDIMDRDPESPLVENCRYWIAQSQYTAGDYSPAAAGFQAVLDDARFDHKDDDAAIMLGITFFRTGRLTESLSVLHRFIEEYPGSEYREKVNRWIEQISLIHHRSEEP